MPKKSHRPVTVALESLGCKLNQAEIQSLARQLEAAGYTVVSPDAGPDIYVLNTCSVTHVADRKSRHLLRLAKSRNPAARLVAIGCYAHRAPAELAEIEGVELVLGNESKMDLVRLLGEAAPPLIPPPGRGSGGRNRAFIKIQDGCKNYCAYCVVPLVRAREYCVPPDEIISQINALVTEDCREAVLTGTEIGAYRAGEVDLEGLVRRILAETGIDRLRLSSLQPHQVSEPLVKLWQDQRPCAHFHLSLQSGSDAVLKRMKRQYTAARFAAAVGLIRQSVPDAAVTTDVIVGFPGETDAEFRATLDFCRQMQFARIHVFPYSPRPGTAAAAMPAQVSAAVKKERARQMLDLARDSARGFRQGFLGRTFEVLWEQGSGGVWNGLTGNYIKVYIKSNDDLADKITHVKLARLYKDGVWGEPVN